MVARPTAGDAVEPLLAPLVSVLMPTYGQAAFIRRALDSLLAQSLSNWEAVIVDDGSRDDTAALVQPYLGDHRIVYVRNERNGGLGRAINRAMDLAHAPLLAYLPSDDVYYRDHLQQLADCLAASPDAVLAFSRVRYHYNRSSEAAPPGMALQLVQCMHRRSMLRWTERATLESDDLERLFWQRLRATGSFVAAGALSCEWVDHPGQRHKRMQEPEGGVNPFRQYYQVREPLRFHTTTGNFIDEEAQFAPMRERADTAPAANGLKILLVGELAYNADRVLALEEQGHTLYGLWMDQPYWYNSVGPLPFGHVQDLPREGWRDAVAQIQPDLIYAQLNWQAVPFAHEVMVATAGIPFVWHFKEGPFICLQKGSWPQLLDLYRYADGRIFCSDEMAEWFDTVVPGLSRSGACMVLDGDLPRRHWFERPRSPLLSRDDGELHTVVPGRPIGLHPADVAELAKAGIHLHFYGDFTHGQWREWIVNSQRLAPRHLHLHANVDQGNWVEEFSRYDAGWLHCFVSDNAGEIRRANWDDLNIPARMATLAMAGVPMIQRRNEGAIVATQTLAKRLGVGMFYDTVDELAQSLGDPQHMARLREQVWRQREQFCFDHHAPGLVDFFRRVIDGAERGPVRRARPA
jgi:glycosyltransferase involved in cell wall biosynthesis